MHVRKKFTSLNTEFTHQLICTASGEYQFKKIKDLETKDLAPEVLQSQIEDVMEKSCICFGLGTSALLANDLDMKTERVGVSICPGPNGAYFHEKKTLHEMTNQIYGTSENFIKEDRPDMFAKELMMYMDHFRKVRLKESMPLKKLKSFRDNLFLGIEYYDNMIQGMSKKSKHTFEKLQRKIRESSDELMSISFS